MKKFEVSFWAADGTLLGELEVEATTHSRAKIKASGLFTCSWSRLTARSVG